MAPTAQRPNDDQGHVEDNVSHEVKPDPGKEGTQDSQQSSSSAPNLIRTSTTPQLSAPSSTTTSPKPSREGSPVRPPLKPGASTGSRVATRSRKNSQDLSPIRGPSASIPTVPSAAAIQRALSATGTPHLPPPAAADFAVDAPRPPRTNKGPTAGSQHPGSSVLRVKSPPPSASSGTNSSFLAARKIDQSQSTPTTPTIVVERPTRSSTFGSESDIPEDDHPVKSGMRTPVRGISGNGPALETVQEGSLPATPAIGTRMAHTSKGGSNDHPERIEENPMEEAFEREANSRHESGNDSAGSKRAKAKGTDGNKDTRKTATAANSAKPPVVQSKRSFTQLPFTKSKTAPSDGSVKNMTVETETVSSIPQLALGGGAGERHPLGRTETGGSLRLKPSNETIRPKKEKKRVTRKAPSVNSGTGGLLFKPFHHHHHHVHSRIPSPQSMSSMLVTSPDSPNDPVAGHVMSDLLSSNHEDKHTQNAQCKPPNSHGTPRHTSTVLIPFRGRIASSKADIFEAKVATAVDEADSSDSEETFVYESNPPEPHSARAHRFHSRTPSATSTISHHDHYGAKGRQEGHHSVVGKKSMKFSNNYNSIGYSNEGDGTVRGPSQTGRPASGNTTHHHHIGRYGRGGHASLFDSDSPFPNATKSTHSATGHVSPRSSRNPQAVHVTKSPRKIEELMSYDLEGEGADDERTPLIGSIRNGRNRRRPLPGSVRHIYAEERDNRCCGRVTAFTSLGSVLAILIAAIVVILIMCSKPLVDVHVKEIQNVLASEQEIMIDLHVHAINPNILAIQVSDLDVNIFAKSKHVGTSSSWGAGRPRMPTRILPRKSQSNEAGSQQTPPLLDPSDIISHFDGGVDEGTDPIDDPDPAIDSQTMLLGQIFEFDSPLIFDASPIRHHSLGSIGEVRLAKPGNRTEEGGSERWEHVLQYDFELIVRGVMKYSLPISSRLRKANIAGSIIVHPSDGVSR